MGNLPTLSPEILVPKLGDYLVERGLITPENLRIALSEQQARKLSGKPALLGQLLVEMKMVERASLDQAVTEQILQLRNALQDANANLEQRVQERTAELERAMKKLAELSKMKANFVANISHELRTPLTHIKGYLELMASEMLGPITEEQSNSLRVMVGASDRLEQLINDLIMLSMTESGHLSLEIKEMELCTSLEPVIQKARLKATEKHIEILVSFPGNRVFVNADGPKITWVVGELLENAIKFSPLDSKVMVLVEKENDMARVSVKDKGPGIPTARLEEIFEPFHQLDGSSTRKVGGTGLGLSLVKKIIEEHGSFINVKSEPGKGSEFYFLLKVTKSTT